MPYEVKKSGNQWCVYKADTDEQVACHPTEAEAEAQRKALYANEPGATRESAAADLREGVVFLEATTPTGTTWHVKLIEAGTSKNRVRYSAAVLKESAHLYEGRPAFEDHATDDEHEKRPEGRVGGKVGVFRNVIFESRKIGTRTVEGLFATFKVVSPKFREMLLEAQSVGEPDFFGLSHNVSADWAWAEENGHRVKDVKRIIAVHSIDLVTDPAAGGRIERLIASDRERGEQKGDTVELTQEQLDKMLADAAEAGAQRGIEHARSEAEAAQAAAAQAASEAAQAAATEHAAQAATAVADPPPGEGAATGTAEPSEAAQALAEARQLREELRRERTAQRIDGLLAEAKISAPSKDLARSRLTELAERRPVEESDIRGVITEFQNLEASFIQESANPQGLGRSFKVGDAPVDQMSKALQGWFGGADVDGVKRLRSLKEGYCRYNGVSEWDFDAEEMIEAFGTKYRSGRDHDRLKESLTTASWAEIFADNLYIMMQKAYVASPYNDWVKFVSDFDDVPDFQTRHWARVGGYGDLPAVAEQGTYLPTTSPGDEEVSFAISKRGFLDDVTFEMIVGDRLNKVRRLPQEMALAAARTLYKFVMEMITTDNANMDYDSTALYDATHSNTGTTALSVAGLDAVTIAMRSQTRALNTAEILGPRNLPKYLIVPNELEGRAQRIVNPSAAYQYAIASPADTETVMDPTRFQGKGIEVVVNDFLTNAKDWWTVADPQQVSTIVMGFLNGNREPELFVQDQPNVGSAFTADKITYKCRHIYGGDIQDHRSFYYQDVA